VLAGSRLSHFDIRISPDNRRVFVAGEGQVRAYDAGSRACRWTTHTDGPVAVSPDGRFLLAGGCVRGSDTGEVVARSVFPRLLEMKGTLVLGQDRAGAPVLLELCGTEAGPPVVTAEADGDQLRIFCPCCRNESECRTSDLGQILECPHCSRVLRLNPFTLRRKRKEEFRSVGLPVHFVRTVGREVKANALPLQLAAIFVLTGMGARIMWKATASTLSESVVMLLAMPVALALFAGLVWLKLRRFGRKPL
jgi:hypothetical protein